MKLISQAEDSVVPLLERVIPHVNPLVTYERLPPLEPLPADLALEFGILVDRQVLVQQLLVGKTLSTGVTSEGRYLLMHQIDVSCQQKLLGEGLSAFFALVLLSGIVNKA